MRTTRGLERWSAGAAEIELADLREFAGSRLASFKLPRELVIVDEIPHNALGKVVKPRLKEMVSPSA